MSDFKPSLLLHVCCAPCAAQVIRELEDEFDLTVFFYNPNIHPRKEYLKRAGELIKYCQRYNIDYVEYFYDPENWFKATRGLENEPEGRKRCEICFWLRLDKTANYAETHGYDFFASTLSISPHKNSEVINRVGEEIANDYGVRFLARDFKKNDGYKKSCQISKEEGFYRQQYCGCIYSLRERELEIK